MPAVLENGPLQVSVSLDPFSLDVRRGGRRLIRGLGLWAAAGESHDQFIQLTEGVIPSEELEPPRRLGAVREAAAGAEAGVRAPRGAGRAAADPAPAVALRGELGSVLLELHRERVVIEFAAAAPAWKAAMSWVSPPALSVRPRRSPASSPHSVSGFRAA